MRTMLLVALHTGVLYLLMLLSGARFGGPGTAFGIYALFAIVQLVIHLLQQALPVYGFLLHLIPMVLLGLSVSLMGGLTIKRAMLLAFCYQLAMVLAYALLRLRYGTLFVWLGT